MPAARIFTGLLGTIAITFVAMSVAHAAANTLVTKGADGKYTGAGAKTWKSTGTTVVFQMADGSDGNAWAQAINDRVTGVKATFDKGQLTVSGMAEAALLERLATLALGGGEADPLAELAGLGGAAPSDTPEGGGSIRASKPTEFAAMAGCGAKDHDPRERFEGEVVEVKQGAFPNVVLKLKVRKPGKSGPLLKTLSYGKVIEVPIVFNQSGSAVDFGDLNNRQNMVAWYLTKGDRVEFHPIMVDNNRLRVDWIGRK